MSDTINRIFGVGQSLAYLDPNKFLVGLECEVESVRSFPDGGFHYFSITEDGSLRNNGREFISVPLDVRDIVPEFQNLHARIECGEDKFSERTSIHVHVNCCYLEQDVVRNIVLLYALFEEVFFKMVEPSRRNNIHCVPLTETYLPSIYRQGLGSLISRWHKYTALNILPLKKYGTIEFRHMEGHDDPEKLRVWLDVIYRLFQAGKQFPINKDTLTHRWVVDLADQIFISVPYYQNNRSKLFTTIENSLLDVKLSCLN